MKYLKIKNCLQILLNKKNAKAQTFIRADLRSVVVCCPAHRIERLPSAVPLNLLKREPFTRQILLFKGEN